MWAPPRCGRGSGDPAPSSHSGRKDKRWPLVFAGEPLLCFRSSDRSFTRDPFSTPSFPSRSTDSLPGLRSRRPRGMLPPPQLGLAASPTAKDVDVILIFPFHRRRNRAAGPLGEWQGQGRPFDPRPLGAPPTLAGALSHGRPTKPLLPPSSIREAGLEPGTQVCRPAPPLLRY